MLGSNAPQPMDSPAVRHQLHHGFKTWDPERHKASRDGTTPRRSPSRRHAARKRPVWIRFVLVPGLTDDSEDMAGSAAFAASLGNVERVEVLPFHQMGRFKWERLGREYTLRNVEPPAPEAVERACAVWRAAGLDAL